MKKLLFVASALAALSLLAPNFGYAQNPYGDDFVNRFGVYTDAVATAAHADVVASIPFYAYLLLINPQTEDGTPVSLIEAFECTVSLNSAVSAFKLEEFLLPGGAGVVNVDDTNDPAEMKYFVGAATPAPVADGVCVLAQYQFMVLNADPRFIFITPYTIPSIPGSLAFQAGGGPPLIPATPSNTAQDYALPVFGFNDSPVSEETTSFGNLKALFR